MKHTHIFSANNNTIQNYMDQSNMLAHVSEIFDSILAGNSANISTVYTTKIAIVQKCDSEKGSVGEPAAIEYGKDLGFKLDALENVAVITKAYENISGLNDIASGSGLAPQALRRMATDLFGHVIQNCEGERTGLDTLKSMAVLVKRNGLTRW